MKPPAAGRSMRQCLGAIAALCAACVAPRAFAEERQSAADPISALAQALEGLAKSGSAAPGASDAEAFFKSKIEPILADNCRSCHGAQKQKSDLRLDTRAAALRGGLGGAAIVPGD